MSEPGIYNIIIDRTKCVGDPDSPMIIIACGHFLQSQKDLGLGEFSTGQG
jgi:hypothetical protein